MQCWYGLLALSSDPQLSTGTTSWGLDAVQELGQDDQVRGDRRRVGGARAHSQRPEALVALTSTDRSSRVRHESAGADKTGRIDSGAQLDEALHWAVAGTV